MAGRRRMMIAYVVLACLLSWAWWVPLIVLGQVSLAGRGWFTHLPGLLGPAVAAVVVTGWFRGRPGLVDLARRCARRRVGWLSWSAVAAVAVLSLLPLALSPGTPAGDLLVFSGAPWLGPAVVL